VGLSYTFSSRWFPTRSLPCSVSSCGRSDCWLKIARIADNGNYSEVSAFLVIVWYTYRNKSSLKLSALVRTIITDATIYFLAMVALQIYIQVSFVLTEVRSLFQFVLYFMIANPYTSGHQSTTFVSVSIRLTRTINLRIDHPPSQ